MSSEKVQVKNKVCLIVHDGWGIALEKGVEGNAIENAETPRMDKIARDYDFTTLQAHGTAVGLSEGLMGNSEVGHLNVGAGRVVWQDIVRIDVSIKKRAFHKNEAILEACKRAKEGNGRLHLMGLISDGGVHSHITHLYALLEAAKEQGVPHTYIHFFGDGRDTAPRSATKYLKELEDFTKKLGYGELATIVGRYYAMDRDKRWERVSVAVEGLVKGTGESLGEAGFEAAVTAVDDNYKKDVTDEFLKPIIVNGDAGRIKDDDTIFTFNYRSDRMRELVTVLGQVEKDLVDVPIPENLEIFTMSQYKKEFPFKVAFPPQAMTNVLAEWLAKKGIKQAHVAETEKYAHVTFFFNGGLEKQFEGEERYMVPSPKVATYDLQPEMNAIGVAEKVKELLEKGTDEFVMCNFAPPDMVGHTGVYDAAVKAIAATDKAVGVIYDACKANGYILMVTADHGNAEQMRNPDTGAPHTAHTTNPVIFIMTGDGPNGKLRFKDEEPRGKMGYIHPEGEQEKKEEKKEGEEEEEAGALCDVAPTVLAVMGIEQPEEMTGRSLLA
ncbi:phosphoglycerate mutase [Coprinellus micaceus]|uniref:2,3-bisphosphoglycerate-independent phosphoglycerate mutase n=1 Tax=Coprinellus micaceus TaxID=71717 RepID=A0A4Y7SC21_COPMI|nr:phosphoglycerate mutase [Coprinellus micaceus]